MRHPSISAGASVTDSAVLEPRSLSAWPNGAFCTRDDLLNMSDVPLVSVVMPVHNSEAVVGDAIVSILGQTLKDFEFIVIDDGSTDDSGKILRKYAGQDKRVKLYSQSQSGLIASLNKHCQMAKAKYIA